MMPMTCSTRRVKSRYGLRERGLTIQIHTGQAVRFLLRLHQTLQKEEILKRL